MPRAIRAVAALLLGVIVAVGALEAALAAALATPRGRAILEGLGPRGATLAAAAKPFGEEAYLVADPDLGWTIGRSPRAGVALDPDGGRATPPAPPDAPVVLAMGDSMTFGFDVADHEAWPARLSAHAGPLRVHNLGVPGYGAGQVLRATERALARLPRVDVVVVGHAAISEWRPPVAFSHGPKPRAWLDDAGVAHVDDAPVPPLRDARAAWLAFPHVRHLPRIVVEAADPTPGYVRQRALVRALLAQTVATVRAAGAVPVLVDLDGVGTFGSDTVRRVCEADPALRCVFPGDALRALAAAGTPLWTGTLHYTAPAHDVVAREVAASLPANAP